MSDKVDSRQTCMILVTFLCDSDAVALHIKSLINEATKDIQNVKVDLRLSNTLGNVNGLVR